MFRSFLKRSLNEYGMLVVLVLLCIYYAWATIESRAGVGSTGGDDCAGQILERKPIPQRVAIIAGKSGEDSDFVDAAKVRLKKLAASPRST